MTQPDARPVRSECLYHEATTWPPWRVTRCAHAGDRSIALYEMPGHRRIEMHRGWLLALSGQENLPDAVGIDAAWEAWLARLLEDSR